MARLAHETVHEQMHANASEHRNSPKKRLSKRLASWCGCEKDARAGYHGNAAGHHEQIVPTEVFLD